MNVGFLVSGWSVLDTPYSAHDVGEATDHKCGDLRSSEGDLVRIAPPEMKSPRVFEHWACCT